MGKWFESVFLPSLFERAGVNRAMWLTVKQTAVCVDNMDAKRVPVIMEDGRRGERVIYSCEWSGRAVVLQYSKRNACGSITFGANEAEIVEAEKRNQSERDDRNAARIARIKANPARLSREVEMTRAQIKALEDDLEDDQTDGTTSAEYTRLGAEKLQALREHLKALCA